MYENLRKLCAWYNQDFDLLFERATDPIDEFCQQNGEQAQADLLKEMTDFYERLRAGERSVADLVAMGLEYAPGPDNESLIWFRDLIGYLESKIKGERPQQSPEG